MRSSTSNVVVDLDAEGLVQSKTDTVVVEEAGAGEAGIVVNEDDDGTGTLPAGAVLNEDGSVTLALKYSTTVKINSRGVVREELFTELTFHRMIGADMRAVSAASKESSVVVAFSRSTKIKQPIMNALFDSMDGADIQAAGEVIEYFFGSGRKTGR